MGSFCKSGPSTTTTTPTGAPQLNDIWGRVSAAASTPYQPYGGQLVADLNPVQQSGISNINAAAGSAQPYFDLASQYGTQGAAKIDPNDLQRYMNPYTQSVINATQGNFNESNAQQQQQIVGNAAARGALGGDRVAVAQAEAARQQKLAQDPVIAGLNSQNYSQALAAAQGDRAAAGQGAFTFGSLAPAIQNSAIQGGQAQIGAGSVAQGNDQQKLSAQYQQYLQALAFPYQQAQFLSSAGLPAVTSMGGTSRNSAAQPSPLSQIAGVGMMGAGLMSMFGGGGGGGMSGGAGSGYDPNQNMPLWSNDGRRPLYARGGRVSRGKGRPAFADGGFLDQVHAIRAALRGDVQHFADGGSVIDMQRGHDGTYYADGGAVDDRFPYAGDISAGADAMANPLAVRKALIELGRQSPFALAGNVPGAPVPGIPMPPPRPAMAGPGMASSPSSPFALPPQITNPGGGAQPIQMPPDAMGYDGAPTPSGGLQPLKMRADEAGGTSPLARPMDSDAPAVPSGGGNPLGMSDTGMALLTAGLGTLASRAPNALSAIGEGGLQGVKQYTENRNDRQKAELEARKLIQQAEQFSQTLGVHKDNSAETRRYHDLLDQQRKDALEETKQRVALEKKKYDVPQGFTQGEGGKLSPVPGGPHDPATIKAEADAKRGSGMSETAIEMKARQVANGDLSALTNIGRGAQAGQTLEKIANRGAELLIEEEGMTPAEAAKHMSQKLQEFKASSIGKSAEARTTGVREANLNLILKATEAAIPAALEASEAVARTGWVPINKIIQGGEVIASNPELRRFGMANLQLAEHWARAMNPTGVMRESDRDMALKFLSTADSKDTYRQVVDQLQKQITRERDAVRGQRSTEGGPGASASAPAAGAPPPAAKPSPTQADRDYARTHPEVKDKFISRFGVEP